MPRKSQESASQPAENDSTRPQALTDTRVSTRQPSVIDFGQPQTVTESQRPRPVDADIELVEEILPTADEFLPSFDARIRQLWDATVLPTCFVVGACRPSPQVDQLANEQVWTPVLLVPDGLRIRYEGLDDVSLGSLDYDSVLKRSHPIQSCLPGERVEAYFQAIDLVACLEEMIGRDLKWLFTARTALSADSSEEENIRRIRNTPPKDAVYRLFNEQRRRRAEGLSLIEIARPIAAAYGIQAQSLVRALKRARQSGRIRG